VHLGGVPTAACGVVLPSLRGQVLISPPTFARTGPHSLSRALAIALPVAALAVGALLPAGAQAATVSSCATTGAGTGPVGIALDSDGNLYTANDTGTVSKILAGCGGAAGAPWPVAAGTNLRGIEYTDAGSIFATDSGGGTVVRVNAATGLPFLAPWPVNVGATPFGITSDRDGNVYSAQAGDGTVKRTSPAGVATTLATIGPGINPYDVAFDQDGNLYTANYYPCTVSKFNADGTAAGAPWPVYLGIDPQCPRVGVGPLSVVVDSSGFVYTANTQDDTVSRVAPGGAPVVTFGVGDIPQYLAVDSARNVYVSNTNSANVSKITPEGTVTVAFASGGGLSGVQGITIDRDGNLYVSNYNGNSVSKIAPVGGDIQPAPPESPAAPSATAGDGSATVTVPANETDRRYGEPSSYTVTAVEDPASTCTVTPPATSCTVSGLANGASYTFNARANLNTWQTAASIASASVTPTAPVTPTATPDPPTPILTVTVTVTVIVTGAKAKVTRNSILATSKVKVSGAGKIAQRATTGNGKKMKSWCRASKTATGAGTYSLRCNLGKKGRSALRKRALKLTLRTTFTPTAGDAVTDNRKLTLKRKR